MRSWVDFTAVICLAMVLLLAACSGSGAGNGTPTPLPTSSLPGLVTIQPQLCRLADLSMLKVDRPQGDLLAWAPGSATLAYLAPTSGSTWMVGNLMVVNEPAFDSPLKLADQAAGGLAWSTDGNGLAYLSLRRSDNLYTVGVAYPQGGISRDLFPAEAARFDEWSSQKTVVGWRNVNRLRVQVSCGLDCVQTMDINTMDGSMTVVGEAGQLSWDWWNYRLNQPVALPVDYQEFMRQPNWSPDGRRLVYLDSRADAWVVSLEEGTQFPLDTGGFLAVSETDWSEDGQYLAVQAENHLFIFGSECP
jgi:hypothetical protein